MNLLLLGESAGSARYLLGTFARAGISVRHVEARERLDHTDESFDVALFSDYPAANLGPDAAASIVRSVQAGAGLIMIGGWASFTGRGNGYRQTPIEAVLPVTCAETDDRRNVWGGLWLEAVAPEHPIFRGLDVQSPPVICGYNIVTPKPEATLLAYGRRVAFDRGTPRAGESVPLLVAGAAGRGRTIAYASDLVPHWCGGIVDWGSERVTLPTGAEVGVGYCTFLTNMLRWVSGSNEA